ncbi:TPA: uracil phosphoribosyltransferase [Acinetobacter baumannii]
MRKQLNTNFIRSQKTIIRSIDSGSDILKESINAAGEEIGKFILEQYFLEKDSVTTPMQEKVIDFMPKVPSCVIVTTKDDFEFFGKGIARYLPNSFIGYIDYEGRRGIQALNTDISTMMLPDTKGLPINTLIVSKAVLATGCTAIHLLKTAIKEYFPKNVLIVSLFHSLQGVAELEKEAPNADIIVVGDSDSIDEAGMLTPGVGNLDLRLKA